MQLYRPVSAEKTQSSLSPLHKLPSYVHDFFSFLSGRGAVWGFRDVAFLPPELLLTPHFLKIVVEVKASGPPHVLELWLGVGKDRLPPKYFCSTRPLYRVS